MTIVFPAGPRAALLAERLKQLQPVHAEIVNESAGHGGYHEGKESHFKATLVSPLFEGLRSVQRHQKVYALLGDALSAGGIHALALHTYTPAEWQGQSPDSPACAHPPK